MSVGRSVGRSRPAFAKTVIFLECMTLRSFPSENMTLMSLPSENDDFANAGRDGRTDGPTDRLTYKASYRDARTHLKTTKSRDLKLHDF